MTNNPFAHPPRRQPWWKRQLMKPWRFAATMGLALVLMSSFVLLDTFLIPRVGEVVDETPEAVANAFLLAQRRAAANETTAIVAPSR